MRAFCSSDMSSTSTTTSNNWKKSHMSSIFICQLKIDNGNESRLSVEKTEPEQASERLDILLQLHHLLPCSPNQSHHFCMLHKLPQ
jgi:phosphotransferase system HPr-like phosphotransfer protein